MSAALDDFLRHVHSHPSAIKAGLEAMGFWLLVQSHGAFYGTGSAVTREVAAWFAGSMADAERLAGRLVDALLWRKDATGGWAFAEMHVASNAPPRATSPTAASAPEAPAKVLARREQDAKRQRLRRQRLRTAENSSAQLSLLGGDAANASVTPGRDAGPSRVTLAVTESVTSRDAVGGKGGESQDFCISLELQNPSGLDLSRSEDKETKTQREIPPTPRDARDRDSVTVTRTRRPFVEPSMLMGVYREGVRLGLCQASGNPRATVSDFRGPAWKDVERFMVAHAPPHLVDQELLDWVQATATAYVVATYAKREYQCGFSPEKCAQWLNADRPQAEESSRHGREVQPGTPNAPWLRLAEEAILRGPAKVIPLPATTRNAV